MTDSRAISTGSPRVINPCEGHATVSASARVSNARNQRRGRAKEKKKIKEREKTGIKTEKVVDVKPNRARFSSSRSIIRNVPRSIFLVASITEKDFEERT